MKPYANELAGGCACGAVRYLATGRPFHRTVCHCTTCQRVSGSPMVAWFTVAAADFSILRGMPKVFRSSDHATRQFCGSCGTQLTFCEDGLSEIDVTVCSLDEPNAVPPDDQTYARSAVAWASTIHTLKAHETTRNEG